MKPMLKVKPKGRMSSQILDLEERIREKEERIKELTAEIEGMQSVVRELDKEREKIGSAVSTLLRLLPHIQGITPDEPLPEIGYLEPWLIDLHQQLSGFDVN
jgi:beta-phosphoglucomutase-like phosphatase (HAD superfamily)